MTTQTREGGYSVETEAESLDTADVERRGVLPKGTSQYEIEERMVRANDGWTSASVGTLDITREDYDMK